MEPTPKVPKADFDAVLSKLLAAPPAKTAKSKKKAARKLKRF